jgi:hypothetical protein
MYVGCEKAPTSPPIIISKDPSCTKLEYHVQYSLPAIRPERRGDGGVETTSITPNQDDLTDMGKEGWDLTGLYLEPETAFAPLERGIYPNTRPQRLVLIFKRYSCK